MTIVRLATRAEARAAVRAWHSHHKPHLGARLQLALETDGRVVGVVVAGDPVAPQLAAMSPRDLAAWCRELPGQVIVCENVGATWLPFRPLARTRSAGSRHSHEAIWCPEGQWPALQLEIEIDDPSRLTRRDGVTHNERGPAWRS